MKKWIIGLFGFVLIILAGIYIFIPRNIELSQTIVVPCKINAVNRHLLDKKEWVKWWPHNDSALTENTDFAYNGFSYQVNKLFYNRIEIFTKNNKGLNTTGFISILDLNNDSVSIQWHDNIQAGNDPFNRISQYQFAQTIKRNMSGILAGLKTFLDKKENIYLTDIKEVVIKDTVMISSTSVFTSRPGIQDVYKAINILSQYISLHGAKETNHPMLNIRKSDNEYLMMVAIPTDKVLDGDDKFKLKRMPRTRILETEVKGGPSLINSVFAQMKYFAEDYHLGASAIPYESLVTNRINEPDTAKWVTKLYFPIY
jgi:hypothetical protein